MGKYTRKRKPNILVKILCVILMLILLIITTVAVFIWKKLDLISYGDNQIDVVPDINDVQVQDSLNDYTVNIDGVEISDTVPTVPVKDISSSKDVINFLLIGTDQRYGNSTYASRADCMIIVSFNKDLKTVRLVSLERGIGVPILEGEHEGEYDLLTHIYLWGGPELLQKTVEYCFKIDIDHYVQLDFNAVTNIIDVIGGIDIELTGTEAWYLGGHISMLSSTGKQQPLREGMNHLDGGLALHYARLREIDSDWQRVGRQRKVILAVVEAVKDCSLSELNDVINTVLPMIQTNMTKMDIAEMMLYALDFLTSEFDQMTIPKQGTYGGIPIRKGGYGFCVDYEINNDLLYRFLYEGASSEELLAE
jgi:LCP family protein required for cell wall assembly